MLYVCKEPSFPPTFLATIKDIYKKIFRIYAIIYSNYFQRLVGVQAEAHLNTAFKHFIFFIWEFELVELRELDAIKNVISELRNKYDTYNPNQKHMI
jgi:MOB kinase activator 1